MKAPTREQVIQWAKDAGLSFVDGWIFYTPKRPSLPEAEIDAFIAAVSAAYAAARAQALDEAAAVCLHINAPDGTNAQAWECASAIQALKGKQ